MSKQTTLCYIEQNESYLMLHRVKKKNDENQGKWIGVGGKFEEGESPEDCVLREVKEETGLTLDDYRYRGIVTFVFDADVYFCEYMHLFTASGFHGSMITCDEGDLEWLPKEELYKLPMWAGDRIFLELLDCNTPFFSLKLVYHGETLGEAVLNGKTLPQCILDGAPMADYINGSLQES